jgi:hypothetical protein
VLLRGIRAQLLTSLATLALAALVTAGAVGVVGAARVGHAPGAIAAMLALYGAVALAEQAARATAARAHDLALARLRGMTGARLVGFAAGPLLAVTLVGMVAGAFAGVALAGRIADGWHTSYDVGAREVVAALVILVGAWVTVSLVAAVVVRQPLMQALSVRPRRLGTPLVARFLEILAVAAAVAAVYEAHRGGHSWVPIIAPALVALAAGQGVAWLLSLTPRMGRGLGPSLTSRRLRRDPDPASIVRILVAATVLLAVTLTGARAAAVWRDNAAHLRAGGPIQVPFKVGALRAYAAALDADPQGHWLMPAVSIDDLDPGHRRVYVAADRWQAVVGDYFSGTSSAAVTGLVSRLSGQQETTLVRAGSVRVFVSGLTGTAMVTLAVVDDRGYASPVRVPLTRDGANTAALPRCRVGCTVNSATVSGPGKATVESVAAGTVTLTHGSSTHDGGGATRLSVAADPTPQPALVTEGLKARTTTVDGIDGTRQASQVVGTVPTIPFLGTAGSLLDLGRVLIGANGSVPAAQAVVVARADTPASVLHHLAADGGGTPTTYGAALDTLRQTTQARADQLAVLVALGVALVAFAHLLAWLAGQVASRRAEVAGLRVAGIRPKAIRSAYLSEAVVLAAIVLVTAGVVSAATTGSLLRPMHLVGGWDHAPAVDLSLRPWVLAAVGLGVAVVTAVSCVVAFTRFGRAARPSALRAAER